MSTHSFPSFRNPTEVLWTNWEDAASLIPDTNSRVFIATGHSSRPRAEKLAKLLSGIHETEISPDITADPTADSVMELTSLIRRQQYDWVIAIGGGSVLDSAKAAAALACQPNTVHDYLRGSRTIENPGVPLVAIPTTAGSGSEVTPYASITDRQTMKKQSLTHDNLYPRYAVLDPALTVSLPPRQTAISGLDALCHSIEGFWSKNATPVTDAFGLAATRLILGSLEQAFRSSDDLAVRQRMLHGSLLAGMTISNAMTTAVHSVSYPLTVHFGVPHGLACGTLLPPFIRYNSGAIEGDKESQLVNALGLKSMDHLADTVDQLKSDMDLPPGLSSLGLGQADISTLVENGFRPDRVNNNPRTLTTGELTDLLIKAI